MYYVYGIKSLNFIYRYIGVSSNIQSRLEEHNKKKVKSTKAYVPLVLDAKREFKSRREALEYEKLIKRNHSKRDIFWTKFKIK